MVQNLPGLQWSAKPWQVMFNFDSFYKLLLFFSKIYLLLGASLHRDYYLASAFKWAYAK